MTAILGIFRQKLLGQLGQIGVNQATYLLHIILDLINTSNEFMPRGGI